MPPELRAANDRSLATYKDALEFLFARTTGGFKFGLDRTFALLQHLGNPQHAYPSLHIAGTNGKGSSVATISALLRARGRRVATYTSPHLVDFRERMMVSGVPIPEEDVIDFVARHTPFVEEIGASFFEATTAMAFAYFARAGADVAVIEAGLGGRLDSTNVLMPVVAGVTSIGLDHTEYLGSTLEAIAREKGGIFKAGRPAVIGERDHHIRSLLAEHAHNAGASSVHVVADELPIDGVEVDDDGTTVSLAWREHPIVLRTPLAGEHQAANLAFSLALLDAAGDAYAMRPDDVVHDLATVRIPGRFQHVGQFIFDVAHNPAGSEVLTRTIIAVDPPRPIVALLCVLRDKDWREMMRVLSRVASHFVLTMAPTAPASRAWDLDEVRAFATANGMSAEVVSDFGSAIDVARARGETVLVTGSFHTVGDAMALLQVSPLAG